MSEKLCALRKIGGGTELLDLYQIVGIRYSGQLVNKSYTLGTSFNIGDASGYCDGYLIECSKATRLQIPNGGAINVLGIKGDSIALIGSKVVLDVSIDYDYLLITYIQTGGQLSARTVILS